MSEGMPFIVARDIKKERNGLRNNKIQLHVKIKKFKV